MAQTLANKLAKDNAFSFSGTSGLGENLYALSSTVVITYVNGSKPVESFYGGASKYNYSAPGFSSTTGQFSQMIWRASTQLGAGIALTNTSKTAYIVINYFPGGNVGGQFPANVPPPCSAGATTAAPAPVPITTTAAAGPTSTAAAGATTTVPLSVNLNTFRNESLRQHNFRRQKHCVPALVLNSTLNDIAQNYAQYLASKSLFVHSYAAGLGENLWYVSSSALLGYVNGSSAVDSWYSEISMYNFTAPAFSSATGHFTQVVWRATTQVGVGIAFANGGRTAYVVANYVPPGNYNNMFAANVPALC